MAIEAGARKDVVDDARFTVAVPHGGRNDFDAFRSLALQFGYRCEHKLLDQRAGQRIEKLISTIGAPHWARGLLCLQREMTPGKNSPGERIFKLEDKHCFCRGRVQV